jgi:uroporphyrinogen III methyltransferase/synthase
MNPGVVYLVGAGCGAADLITLRGLELLRRCDAVVYDDLIDPALLDMAPPQAQRLYMGKRSGRHSAPQAQISAQLVALAQQGQTVVRLKGGDPFVFGRGGEEVLALQAADIPYEVVPGISSAIAIPAAAGIPVTHRGSSRSFHVITGHTADTPDALPPDLETLAKLDGTLVFLMGLGRLRQIAQRLMDGGLSPQTPAAVLSGGSSPHPAAVRGPLAEIGDLAAHVQPPAVIVVGQTAALDLSPTVPRPLAGVRVGITGTQAVADKLRTDLAELGAGVSWVERSAVVELPLDLDLEGLCSSARWVVFTSANGVHLFFRHLSRQRIDLRRLHGCKFAVIGPATGEALTQHGLYPALCPPTHTSAGLALALREAAEPGEEILLFRSAQGAPILPQLLTEAGCSVQDLPVYRIQAVPSEVPLPPLDYLTFSSSSGVELFFRQYGPPPPETVCVCIGDVTAQALRARTDAPFLTAAEISTQGLVAAILQHHQTAPPLPR